jgi:hypothetical protein
MKSSICTIYYSAATDVDLVDGANAGFHVDGNAAGSGVSDTTSNQTSISLIIKFKITSFTSEANDTVLVALPTGT